MIVQKHAGETFREVIDRAYAARRLTNASYSLRAFARDLGISAELLSAVLRGTRGLSRKSALAVAMGLKFSEEDSRYFCDLVDALHARDATTRRLASLRTASAQTQVVHSYGLDVFRLVSDWYHLGILELLATKGFRSDSAWIASRLGVEAEEIDAAVERLQRLELMTIDVTGAWRPLGDFVAGPDGISSDAVRKFHAQIITRALESLQTQALHERDVSSLVMAFDPADMGEAKKLIRDFRRSFEQKLARKNPPDRVYCLGMQFFRLDRDA
ncbi:MAG: TIGR02147 family protein [Bdellovibrionota bacterium]